MSDILRRLYNAVERLFDWRALSQELHFTRNPADVNEPRTARHAFEIALSEARELDRGACLKLITAPDGLNPNGAASRWEFFFDLPMRRAKLECDWYLPWDANADQFGPPRLEVIARPFPPADNVFRQMVKEGKLLHRQLIGLWNQERRQRPDLPHQFRDSDAALEALVQQGLKAMEIEFSFGTVETPEGKPCWLAQTRERSYYTDLV